MTRGQVVISARGEQRVRSGHPWIYRADVVDVDASGRRHRRSSRSATPQNRRRAVQRSIADSDQDAHARRSGRRRGADPRAPGAGARVPRIAAAGRHRVPGGPRRRRPAAVADRRPLRRLLRRAGAVAGHGSAAAVDYPVARRTRTARRHPGAQRPEGAGARRPRADGRGPARRDSRVGGGARGTGRVRRGSAAWPEDRPVPRSAGKPRRRRPLRVRPPA